MRVLLVEDEVQLAEVISDGLAEHGVTADVEHDGPAGLWRAREGSYDVIVLDIMVPGMNGYQICRALRQEEDWTPILMLTAKDGEWDVAVTLAGAPASPIVGVESQIERAVFNLVDNAVAHADQHVLITLVESATAIAVMVEDDGPGIPPEDRVRVLDRFVRLDESRQRRTGNSGLGLSLSHAIAKRHRGSIDVGDSEHLGGARVTIELPLPDTEPADPTATIT